MGMTPFPLLPLSLLLSLAQSESAPTTATGALLDQRELQVACARLAGEFPREVSLVPLYESPQGRRVDALRVARGELTAGRPAVLVVPAGVDQHARARGRAWFVDCHGSCHQGASELYDLLDRAPRQSGCL